MKKSSLFLFISLFVATVLSAQTTAGKPDTHPASQTAAINLSLPVGVFGRSHIAGAGFEYARSNHRFGQNIKPEKFIGFTYTASADYFLGKKTNTAGYPFRYGNYLYVNGAAGIICNPTVHSNFSLTAGPSAGIYKTGISGGVMAKISGNYYADKNISIGPALVYRKHADADALWALAIKVSYVFN